MAQIQPPWTIFRPIWPPFGTHLAPIGHPLVTHLAFIWHPVGTHLGLEAGFEAQKGQGMGIEAQK